MASRAQGIRTVVVVARLNFQSGRDILYGISRYAARRGRWRLHIITDVESPSVEELKQPELHHVDGIIADSVLHTDALAALEGSAVPLVLIGPRPDFLARRRRALACVMNDDESVGAAGARHLASMGRFRSFGFVPHARSNYCSDARQRGFCGLLASQGRTTAVFRRNPSTPVDSLDEVQAIADWLRTLEMPAAVMAVHDLRATTVMEAAQLAKLRIPQDLAVIGVDNDALLCDFTSPPLTSIAPDHVHEGELAAAKLDDLLRGKSFPGARPCLNTRRTIVERQSARPLAPGEHLAAAARAYIGQEALNGITAADVARHLGVSRRLADLRFRQFEKKSLLEAITDVRLEALKRRLADGGSTISQTSAACGFHNEGYAKRLFKAHFGLTMRDYRAKLMRKTPHPEPGRRHPGAN